ncbi:MAG: hypothetical protein JRF45_15705 [Deltaproteobacteria bacterium]|nr:hypothetical protein [Deltaproteobacteria bacterium]MBW1970613.1 hypothetical protein [Deltaproteobacteria bacterium]MBW2198067.1 hypothetical protein [Deltaproteobacteria bacterium]MBW2228427.1 hypothetical protein [Deltaproteobacteria bacterium]MBW2327879.1 hypothetical protein [Deltaproteobacteria bacterium]
MNRMIHLFSVVVLCSAAIFNSTVYARSSPTAEDDPCSAPNIRTDVRPNADGEPIKVTVGIYMFDLMEIHDIDQTLTGDFGVVLSWVDPRLSQLEGCEMLTNDIWSPGLVFLNSGRKFTTRPKKVGIGPGGQVKYIQRYSGTFATYHNLSDFPFDKQSFRISLFSLEWWEEDVMLVVNEKFTGRQKRLNISDWTIKEVEATIGRYHDASHDRFKSRYDFNISAERIKAYYLWKVIFPLCLIVFMSWCVFWVNPALYGPQIGLSATSMLTLIATIFATANYVPRLGYLTLLDRFVIGSTTLVFLALLESLLTIYLVSKEKKELAMRIDNMSRLVFPIAFGTLSFMVFFI